MEPKTLQQAIVYFADPDNCVAYLVARRWPKGVSCPTCGREDVSYVAKRRVWQCKSRHPKCQFSAKVGTVMEDSPIGLDKWLMAMWMIANCKNGVSSWEIHRTIGVTQKTAWFLLHRLRLAMGHPADWKMSGVCEVDESFVGGSPKNWHLAKRARRGRFVQDRLPNENKTAVVGLLNRDAREVRAKVVPNVSRETLQEAILSNIEGKSTVYTDAAHQYRNLPALDYIHETVNHVEEYVRGDIHTNGLENFWALLKRGLKGPYVATKDNPLTDSDRFALAVSQTVGKRLTYSELTGKDDARPF